MMNKVISVFVFVLLSMHGFAQFQVCNSPTNEVLNDVHFVDQNVGVAVGDLGTIVRSADGGLNWDLVYSNDSIHLTNVKFFDANHGIALGSDMLRTNDGGLTWTIQYFENNQFNDFDIVNETTCVVSGYFMIDGSPGKLIKSTDMGLTWEILADENTEEEFHLLSFVNENIGFATMNGSSIQTLKTIDGGFNWELLEAPADQSNTTVMEAMSFVSEEVGFKAGWYNGHLQKTEDGANNWIDAGYVDSMLYPQLFDIHIEPNEPNAYYACGWYGEIFKSIDGGSNWKELDSGVSNITTLRGIFFIDDVTGWVVGVNGVILKTTTGGLLLASENIKNKLDIQIFPNPTSDYIQIKPNGNIQIEKVDLMNIKGQLIQSFQNKTTLNLNSIPASVYFLRIETNEGIHIQEIVKD